MLSALLAARRLDAGIQGDAYASPGMKPPVLLPAEELLMMMPYRQRKPQAAHPRPVSRGAHRLAVRPLARMLTPRRISAAQDCAEELFFVMRILEVRIDAVECHPFLVDSMEVDGGAW